jgi:hypothetical protein
MCMCMSVYRCKSYLKPSSHALQGANTSRNTPHRVGVDDVSLCTCPTTKNSESSEKKEVHKGLLHKKGSGNSESAAVQKRSSGEGGRSEKVHFHQLTDVASIAASTRRNDTRAHVGLKMCTLSFSIAGWSILHCGQGQKAVHGVGPPHTAESPAVSRQKCSVSLSLCTQLPTTFCRTPSLAASLLFVAVSSPFTSPHGAFRVDREEEKEHDQNKFVPSSRGIGVDMLPKMRACECAATRRRETQKKKATESGTVCPTLLQTRKSSRTPTSS